MPKTRISRSSVGNLPYPGKQTDYFDTKLIGFGVRVNQNSSSYFVQCYVKDKKEIKTTIGKVGVWTFDDALNRAKKIIEDAAHGISPQERREEKEFQKSAALLEEFTIEDIFKDYIATRKKLKPSTIDSYKELIKSHIPDWQNIPMKNIDGNMIVSRHAEIGKRNKAGADGVMRVVRALYNHAIGLHEDIIVKNPVRKLSTLNAWYKLGRRKTYLRPEDIKSWLATVMAIQLQTQRDFILIMLFTGCRRSEAGKLTWGKVNLQEGYVIFRETKTGEPLEVPLCSFMIDVLTKRKESYAHEAEDYVFPSYGKRKHIFDIRNTLEVLHNKTGISISNHDLRRSFLTYCNILKIPPYTIKRLVNHALPIDVTEGYIQFPMAELRCEVERVTSYILEKADMIQS